MLVGDFVEDYEVMVPFHSRNNVRWSDISCTPRLLPQFQMQARRRRCARPVHDFVKILRPDLQRKSARLHNFTLEKDLVLMKSKPIRATTTPLPLSTRWPRSRIHSAQQIEVLAKVVQHFSESTQMKVAAYLPKRPSTDSAAAGAPDAGNIKNCTAYQKRVAVRNASVRRRTGEPGFRRQIEVDRRAKKMVGERNRYKNAAWPDAFSEWLGRNSWNRFGASKIEFVQASIVDSSQPRRQGASSCRRRIYSWNTGSSTVRIQGKLRELPIQSPGRATRWRNTRPMKTFDRRLSGR